MKAKLLHEDDGQRTFALVFDTGDSVMEQLKAFAAKEKLTGAQFTGIGAFSAVTLGYFDWSRKEYERIDIDEQLEVLSLIGDLALQGSAAKLHAHVVLGRRDASTRGGHLLHAVVRPTLEVLLTDSPALLRREFDPATGLALIRPGA